MGKGDKYKQGDYYSESALASLKSKDKNKKLVYEHMVPKTAYIQKPLE